MSTDVFDPRSTENEALMKDLVSSTATRALFRKPRRGGGGPELPHVPFLFWLVEILQPASIVSLGLSDGEVYFALCQAAEKLDRPAQCLGMSVLKDDSEALQVPEELLNYNEANYGGSSELLAVEVERAAKACSKGTIDLLFVGRDAKVSRETLLEDWLPRLSDRGVIVLSDLNDNAETGRREVVEALRGLTPCILRYEGNGLLVCLAGEDQPHRLAGIAAMSPNSPGYSEFSFLFRRAGDLLVSDSKVNKSGQDVDSLMKERDEALAQQDKLRARLDEVEKAYNVRFSSIADLQSKLHDNQVAKRQYEARAQELEDALTEMESRLTSQSSKLKSVQIEFEARNSECATLREEIEALARQGEVTAASLHERFKELAILTNKCIKLEGELVEEKKAHIGDVAELNANLAALREEFSRIENHRHELLTSTSWRLTAPVRALRRSVQRK